MKKVMWFLAIIVLIVTLIVLRLIPDTIPAHWNAAGEMDRMGSKYEHLIVPALILVTALIWHLLIRRFEKKKDGTTDDKERSEAELIARILTIGGIVMVAVYAVLQGVVLYRVLTGG